MFQNHKTKKHLTNFYKKKTSSNTIDNVLFRKRHFCLYPIHLFINTLANSIKSIINTICTAIH